MISEFLDGRIVCLECSGISGPPGPIGWDQMFALHQQAESMPETNCAHVRSVRQARWEAAQENAKRAGEDLAMKLLLQSAGRGEYPDAELNPGPPPDWMVA